MYVRVNEDIQSKQDIMFLINSLINRQVDYFSKQDILDLAIKCTTNSPVSCSKEELEKMIEENIDVSCRYGIMSYTSHGYKNIIAF